MTHPLTPSPSPSNVIAFIRTLELCAAEFERRCRPHLERIRTALEARGPELLSFLESVAEAAEGAGWAADHSAIAVGRARLAQHGRQSSRERGVASPSPVRLELLPFGGVVIRVRCPCGDELEHRDPFAVCDRCGAEVAVDLERAGVTFGRA